MNREEIVDRINKLPLFELRDLKVMSDEGEFVNVNSHKGVCEEKNDEPLAFVTPRYSLMQMKEIFIPLLDSIEGEVNGTVVNYGGKAAMTVFPDDERLKQGANHYGLVAVNSVDMSTSVIINFCVKNNGRKITIPANVGGLKKQHSKKTGNIVKDYFSMIGPVKQAWTRIIEKFPSVIISDADPVEGVTCLRFDAAAKHLELGERLTNSLRKDYDLMTADNKGVNLWQLFTMSIDTVSERNYKSDYHRQARIDKLCNAIFKYAALLGL